nr:ribosome recycling factor family protein [Thaumasiovibrio subtropicus]
MRRVGRIEVHRLSELFAAHQCQLKRIGRSRNYLLIGEYDCILASLIEVKEHAELEDSASLKRVHASIYKETLRVGVLTPTHTLRISKFNALDKQDRDALIALITETRLTMKRIRYGRHIDITGQVEQLTSFTHALDSTAVQSLQPVTNTLQRQLKSLGATLPRVDSKISLINAIRANPSITVAELCFQFGCTTKAAREALDEYEFLL